MLEYAMSTNSVAFRRRNILGALYRQCDPVSSIPVYLDDTDGEPIGTMEENPNQYADSFIFHLPDNICKKLSTNSFDIGIDYDFADENADSNNRRIKLNHIILAVKKSAVPIPRRNSSSSSVKS
jgi:hypothetical protein